ncbi:MAG: dihydrolipoyl dehydrogenase [Candidatus Heimdallarchaeota archaeon]|nr:dihydrolipoyl dehydrogenase [Candidatus Heimdallarchaeota archaeon]
MVEIIDTEIAIIGGGPAGYVAAIRATQLGGKVLLIERAEIGGTCLNRGCIPTKALVESARRFLALKEARKFGLEADNIGYNFLKIQKRKNQIVKRLVKGIEFLLKNNQIRLIKGQGSFIDSHTLSVKGDEEYKVNAKKVIIATGSKALSVPIPGIDGTNVCTSKEILELNEVPTSLIIIGGGVIGDEFASIFNALGSKVTIIEMLPKLIPMEDTDLGEELELAFKRVGIACHLGSRVTRISDSPAGEKVVTFTNTDGEEQHVEAKLVLVSIGRASELEGLNLEVLEGLEYKRGITVNSKMETSIPNIYAIGDVTQGVPSPMLAYTASHEGEVAVENALGGNVEMEYFGIPSTIFTFPEVSSVGLTEEKAKNQVSEISIGKFPFQGNGRALIEGENRGFVKVILDRATEQILGVHIIGPHATELIAEGALLVKNRMTAKEIIEVEHGHPVLYESIKEAVLDALGRAIHK